MIRPNNSSAYIAQRILRCSYFLGEALTRQPSPTRADTDPHAGFRSSTQTQAASATTAMLWHVCLRRCNSRSCNQLNLGGGSVLAQHSVHPIFLPRQLAMSLRKEHALFTEVWYSPSVKQPGVSTHPLTIPTVKHPSNAPMSCVRHDACLLLHVDRIQLFANELFRGI